MVISIKKRYVFIVLLALHVLSHATIISTTKGLKTVADVHGVTWTFTAYETDDGIDSALITRATLPTSGYDGVLAIPGEVTTDGVRYYKITSVTGNAGAKTNILGRAGADGVTTLDLSSAIYLTCIGDFSFFQFNDLAGQLTMPRGVRHIGADAFYNTLLDKVLIPDSVNYIGDYAFALCKNLTTTDIPVSVTYIGAGLFYNNIDLSMDIGMILHSGVTYIGDGAFYNCQGIKGNLTIPCGVAYIGKQAFYNCMALTGDVIIPEGVSVVSQKTFYRCAGLGSVTYKSPALDLTNATGVFDGCSALKYIDMSAATTLALPSTINLSRTSSRNNPFYNVQTHTIIYLPNHSKMNKSLVGKNVNYVYHDATKGWISQSMSLFDTYSCQFPLSFIATKITYDRVFVAKQTTSGSDLTGFSGLAANTIYLPYTCSLPSTMGAYEVTGMKRNVVGLTQVTPNTNGTTTLVANTPYVIRFNDSASIGYTASIPTMANVNVLAMTDGVSDVSPNNTTWVLHGTTKSIDNATAAGMGAYNLYDNEWHQVINDEEWASGYIAQFRCYITSNSIPVGAAPQLLPTDFSCTTTGVGITNKDTQGKPNAQVYSIDGRFVGNDLNALPNGIYVVNGKKVVKKYQVRDK